MCIPPGFTRSCRVACAVWSGRQVHSPSPLRVSTQCSASWPADGSTRLGLAGAHCNLTSTTTRTLYTRVRHLRPGPGLSSRCTRRLASLQQAMRQQAAAGRYVCRQAAATHFSSHSFAESICAYMHACAWVGAQRRKPSAIYPTGRHVQAT